MELGTRPGPVTKIRYRWVCERPVDLLLDLGTRSKVTIFIYTRLSLWYDSYRTAVLVLQVLLFWSTVHVRMCDLGTGDTATQGARTIHVKWHHARIVYRGRRRPPTP